MKGIKEVMAGGRKVEDGVAKVAVLVTAGFDKNQAASLHASKRELLKQYINLIVIPADLRTKSEYVLIGALEEPSCNQSYLREGLHANHYLDGYLSQKIAECECLRGDLNL